MKWLSPVLAALLALSLLACASVAIKKVPSAGQHAQWDDTKQQGADAMEGLRFYMSRPFVAVHEPFPLHADSFLVDGVVSPDGQHVRLSGDLSLAKFAPLRHAVDAAASIPTVLIFPPGSVTPTAQAASEEDGTPAPPDDMDMDGGTGMDGDMDMDDGAQSGKSSLGVATDLAVGHFPLRRYFDLVYLPDHDEQYVLETKGRLGNLDANVKLGPGGVLSGMDVEVDNSALVNPLLNAYAGVVKALGGRLESILGVPAVAGVAQPTPEAQSLSTEELGAMSGTKVTLRVHVIRFAAPGLYPILKPRELREATAAATATAIADDWLVPVRPYGSVAYKSFEMVVVERLLAERPSVVWTSSSSGGGSDGSSLTNADVKSAIDGLLRTKSIAATVEVSGFAPDSATDMEEVNSVDLEWRDAKGGPLGANERAKAESAVKAAWAGLTIDAP